MKSTKKPSKKQRAKWRKIHENTNTGMVANHADGLDNYPDHKFRMPDKIRRKK